MLNISVSETKLKPKTGLYYKYIFNVGFKLDLYVISLTIILVTIKLNPLYRTYKDLSKRTLVINAGLQM